VISPHRRELLAWLARQERDKFTIAGRIDDRRYLAREFPSDLPLILTLQSYPAYKRMVGENWMHWHDYYEFWVATEGGGDYRSGNHRFNFDPGDVVLVDPLKIHGVLGMESTHAPLVIFFRADAVAPTGSEVDRGFLSAWDRRPETVPPRLKADAAATAPVHAALLRLARAWFEKPVQEGRPVSLKFHLLEVLMHLRQAFSSQGEMTSESVTLRSEREARLVRVLEYVGQHCHAPLSQPEVARTAGMSTSRFRAFFKETTGWGFADYVRDLRLDRAARLLRESGESVAAIAYRTGFADQSHLQRLFKAKHAISPLSYRKLHQPG
jgi:AraC-like DNA-binding protein